MRVKDLIRKLEKLDPDAEIYSRIGSLFRLNPQINLSKDVFTRTEWSDGTRHWERKEILEKSSRSNRRGIVSNRKLLNKDKEVFLI